MGEAAIERLLLQAVEHYDGGQPDRAEALCADILSAQPDHLAALHLSAVIAFVTDRAAEGAKRLAKVFSVDPGHAGALATLGDALAVKGEHEGAVGAFEQAVAQQPGDASLHAKLGASLCDLSRFEEAEASLRRALTFDPGQGQARFNLAVALAGQGRFVEAEEVYRAVIARDPACRGAWLNLGNVLSEQNKLDEAITHYRHATAIAPNDLASLRALGIAQHEAGQLHDALQTYRKILGLASGDVITLNNLAACLCELKQYDDALAACDLALALNPDHALTYTNRGVILEAQDDIAAAAAAYRRAIEADPSSALAHSNLASVLHSVDEFDEALVVSRRAVELGPDDPLGHFNYACGLLMTGDLKTGFKELCWGRKCKFWAYKYLTLSQPEWQGEPFPGRTLLLYSEHGFGDALQFVRYLPMATALGGSIVLQVQPELVPLLGTMEGVTIVPRGEPLPPFDLQLPLMDLSRVFGTTVDTIPAPVPYLHPDPARVVQWRAALGDTKSLKVGVVWAGNPTHSGDRQRSLPAEKVLPRLVMPGAQLYSLQKEPRPTDVPVLAALRADIIDLGPRLGDFAATAAAMAALDLVISVDTSVAHLAGALGRPVWVLLPHALDWRWLRDREDSPWYPTMRLFRQKTQRVWDDVLTRVPAELARVVAGERRLL